MKPFYLLLPLVVSLPAHAADNLIAQAIMDAIETRHRAEAANNLRHVTAIYLGSSSGCSFVAVKVPPKPSHDHYRVCDGVIEERRVVPPAPPNHDPTYRKMAVEIGRQALLMGSARSRFDGYLIEARRVGWPDSQGCGLVDVVVSYDGLLVDSLRQPARVCP
jgi:hypothetical protein